MTNTEAIDELKVLFDRLSNPKDCERGAYSFSDGNYVEAIYKAIKALEKRPQGEWIDTGYMNEYWAEEYQCSICGAKDHWHNYCPKCGADMMKGKDNDDTQD